MFSMNTASQIIDNIGPDAICARIGIKSDALAKARKAERLPAPWYAALCEMAGQDLPRHVFSFKAISQAVGE